jgi:cytochrome c-type biogenesis protein CcmH
MIRARVVVAQVVAALAGLMLLGAAADPADRLADPAQEARARALFQDVRCVVCQNQSIDDSDADVARDLRQAVRRQVAAGQSDGQVRDYLVARYGDFILLKPRFSVGNALLWLGPFAVVLAGLAALASRARRPRSAASDLSEDEEARLETLSRS